MEVLRIAKIVTIEPFSQFQCLFWVKKSKMFASRWFFLSPLPPLPRVLSALHPNAHIFPSLERYSCITVTISSSSHCQHFETFKNQFSDQLFSHKNIFYICYNAFRLSLVVWTSLIALDFSSFFPHIGWSFTYVIVSSINGIRRSWYREWILHSRKNGGPISDVRVV